MTVAKECKEKKKKLKEIKIGPFEPLYEIWKDVEEFKKELEDDLNSMEEMKNER